MTGSERPRHAASEPPCPNRDAVVALFLDGVAPGGSSLERDDLDQHRSGCADCRRHLGRARRLDALVSAAVAGPSGDDAQADDLRALGDEWIRSALDVTRSDPLAEARPDERRAGVVVVRRHRLVRLASVLALISAGVALGWWVGSRAAPGPEAVVESAGPRDDDRPPEPRHRSAGIALSPGMILLPDDAPLRLPRRLPDRAQLASFEYLVESDSIGVPALAFTAVRDGLLIAPYRVAAECAALRREAASRLVATGPGWDVACRLGVELPDDARLAILLAALRAAPSAARLVDRIVVDDPRDRRLAARLGLRVLDRRLVDWAAGDPQRSDELAMLVRPLHARPGRADLLLDLWAALSARQGKGDEVVRSLQWFEGQPSEVTADVVARLSRTRSGDDRRRCMLALAALRDPLASDELTAILDGASRGDATLAAYALGRLPSGLDKLADTKVSPRARPLWFAALASRADPRALRITSGLALSEEERALLDHGGLSIAQIEIAARLFRDRASRSD